MPDPGPARPPSRVSARVVAGLGIGAIAAVAAALVELGFSAARWPAAVSDWSGLGVAVVHLGALFWVVSLVISVALSVVWGFPERAPVQHTALAVLLAGSAVGAIAVGHHAESSAARVGLCVAALLATQLALRAVRRPSVRSARLCIGAVVVVSLFALAVFVPGPLRARARWLVYAPGSVSAALAQALRALVDVDRDGAAPTWLGGADCAEANPARGPLVREVPGDGIDQDCRGGDARRGAPLTVPALPPECVLVPARQNVLLVTTDTLSADSLRSTAMPELTDLARRGVTFLRAYSTDLGVTTRSMWPELLRAAGYRTALFTRVDAPPSVRRGFERQERATMDVTSAALGFITEPSASPFVVWAHYGQDGAAPFDQRLGQLLAGVQKAGLFQSTVVVVTASRGRAARFGAGVFEPDVHVPLVVWAPGCRPHPVESPRSLTDLGATLGSLLGVPIPGHGLFAERTLPIVAETVVGSGSVHERAVIGPRYELLVDVNDGGELLFDLVNDPDELEDVSEHDPAALELMERELQRWLDSPDAR